MDISQRNTLQRTSFMRNSQSAYVRLFYLIRVKRRTYIADFILNIGIGSELMNLMDILYQGLTYFDDFEELQGYHQ